MPIDSVIHTNHHSIDRVLNAGLPVVLVFWDPSVAPAGGADHAMDRLAAQSAGRALIATVDAQEEGELLQRFQISGAPSFAFVQNGQVIERTLVSARTCGCVGG